MPKYLITDRETGRKLRVSADGPPPTEAEARQIFDSQPITPSGAEPSFAASVGRGAMDVAQGLKQLYLLATNPEAARQYTAQVNREIRQYELDRPREAPQLTPAERLSFRKRADAAPVGSVGAPSGVLLIPGARPGFDIGRAVGAIGATAPLALVAPGANLASTMLRSGAAGGVAGGSLFSPEGTLGQKAQQATVGGIAGLVAPPVLRGAARVSGAAFNAGKRAVRGMTNADIDKTINVILEDRGTSLADLTTNAQQSLRAAAREQLRATGELDPASLARKADFEALGIKGTRGQITRDPTQFQFEQNTAGIEGAGDALRARFVGQQQELKGAVDRLARQARDGEPGTIVDAGRRAIEAINKGNRAARRLVSRKYTEARGALGGDAPLDSSAFEKKISGTLNDYEDVIPSAVKKRIGEMMGGDRPFTVNEAEKLRKLINKRMSSTRELQSARGELTKALDKTIDDLGQTSEKAGPLFKAARDEASKRFKAFDNPILKAVETDRVTADDFVKRFVIGGKIDDLAAAKRLADSGSKAQRARGMDAWNAARAQVIEHLLNKATAGHGVDGVFSGAALDKAIRQIGPEKLRVLLNADEFDQLQRIGRVGYAATSAPALSKVNASNTASALANLVQRMPGRSTVAGEVISRGTKAIGNAQRAKMIRDALRGGAVDQRILEANKAAQLAQLRALADMVNRGVAPAAGALSTEVVR